MKNKFNNSSYLVTVILFVITIILNYMSASGILFKFSQADISHMYENLLAPAGGTFSIWGIIYIGMALFLALPFFKRLTMTDEKFYYRKLMPIFIGWEVCNLIWTITWNNDIILLSLITIMAYCLVLINLVKTIDKNKDFSKRYKYFVTFPAGLHAGWLIFATFTNIMVLLVKEAINPYGFVGVIITLVLMALACLMVFYVYKENPNPAVVVPALWALFGIMAKQSPGSSFRYRNILVFIWALALFVLGILAFIFLFKKNRKYNR